MRPSSAPTTCPRWGSWPCRTRSRRQHRGGARPRSGGRCLPLELHVMLLLVPPSRCGAAANGHAGAKAPGPWDDHPRRSEHPQGTPAVEVAGSVPIRQRESMGTLAAGRPGAAPDRTRGAPGRVWMGNAGDGRARRAVPADRPGPGPEPAPLPPDRGRPPPVDPRRPDRSGHGAAGDPGLREAPRRRGGDGDDGVRAARGRGVPRAAAGTRHGRGARPARPAARACMSGPPPGGADAAADLVHGATPAVLRRLARRAAVRLPDRRHQARPVPRRALGAAAAARVARPRVGPGVGDDLPLPRRRPAAARGAGRLSRDVAGRADRRPTRSW